MDACVIGNVCANHYVLVCAGLPGCPEQGGESRVDGDVKPGLGQLRLTLVRPGLLPPVTRDDRQLSPTVMIQLVWPFSVQSSLNRTQLANSAQGNLSMIGWELEKEYG